MNCQNHPEVPAAAYCRTCGMAVCDACRYDAFGTVYCAQHAPAAAPPSGGPRVDYAPPGAMPPPFVPSSASHVNSVSPALAFFLGMIPGVGAIYNGQYAKGMIHAIVWGVLMSICNSRATHGLEAIFVMLLIAWWAYMAIEAHRTAQKLQAGEPVDEYSSLLNLHGTRHQAPVAGVALVVLGIMLLLHTLDLLDFEYVARYWPVLLIAGGVYLLWGRFAGHEESPSEVRHGR